MDGSVHEVDDVARSEMARQRSVAASTSTRTAWWSCAAIVVVCLAVGLPTVRSDNYFLGDDFGLVQHLHDLPAKRFLSYFVSDWTEGIYGYPLDELRPFLAFSYWLDAHVFGPLNVSGYHVTNLILHLANALLVLAIARSIAPGEPAFALLAASLFALMPSHAEPVAWISGRVDSIAALFYLGAFLCFVRFRIRNRRRWLLGALLVFACGLFAKQSLVTLPLLILAFDMMRRRSVSFFGGRSIAWLWPHLPFFVLAVAYLALRQSLFGNAVRQQLITVEVFEEFFFRQHRYLLELLPVPVGVRHAKMWLAGALTIGVLAVCSRWLYARRQACGHAVERSGFYGIVWYGITIAPMVVTYFSPRHLYITSAGVSIALASLILPGDPVENRRRTRIRLAMAGMIVVLYAGASIWNVSNWVASGVESQRFVAAASRLLQSAPRDSLVLVSAPESLLNGWFWSWATPFALQPPFMTEDLYEKFRIVERPTIYCCPPDQWWAARKGTLLALMDSPAPQQVTYVVLDARNPEAPLSATRTVDGPALKRRIETALGRSVQSLTGGITLAEAQELGQMLFE